MVAGDHVLEGITMRKALMPIVALLVAAAAMLGAPSGAAAAQSCRDYDSYQGQAGTLCFADADDYPWYSDWGFIPGICLNLWPADIDDEPMMQCMAMSMPLNGYRWVNGAWQPTKVNAGKVYVWKFAPGWRWVWRDGQGWSAVQSSKVKVSWFTPAPTPAAAGRWG
jgi:hypothetical protein